MDSTNRSVSHRGAPRLAAKALVPILGLVLGAASPPRHAGASEIEPDGITVPQPPPPAELTAAALLSPASEVRLDRLIVAQTEALESIVDAHLPLPGFAPLCNMTAQMLLRGGTCEVSLGWYNVVSGQTKPPTADQVYSLVPANDPMSMPRPDYTPGVGVASPVVTVAQIRSDPHYAGGLIGFAMLGDDRKTPAVCTQTHFMDPALNPVCTTAACMGKPWIAALSYQSTAKPNAYYFLFEEKPMSATDFGNDGDFNDQVFLVTGVTCNGGGQPCDTGKLGVCQRGVTQCGKGGVLTCAAPVQPAPEVCDGLDNDCDGFVDPGASCADATQVCDRGRCVPSCNDVTAPCGLGLVCDAGVCKAPTCAGVACAPGKVCVAGVCQDGCMRDDAKVACPHGQVCRVGRCVDPCEGVTCAAGQICEDGACVAPCNCRACPTGKSCTRDNVCVDTGCQNTACPDQMTCIAGVCRDLCYFTLCPAGQFCSMGQCIPTMPSATGSGGFVGIPDAGGFGGRVGTVDAGATEDLAPEAVPVGAISTCSCDAGAPGPGTLAALALVGLALAFRSRRRSGS